MKKSICISSGLYSNSSSVEGFLNNSSKLIIAVAGFGYSLDMPVFYYLSKHLDELDSDLIQIDLGYLKNSEFLSMSEEQQDRIFYSDIEILKSLLSKYKHNEVILIGKSLGSSVCLELLKDPEIYSISTKSIWLTPGTSAKDIYKSISVNKIQNLVIYGSSDPYTTQEMIDEMIPNETNEFYCIQDGDHGLKSGNVNNTVHELEIVMDSIFSFIRK